MSATNSYSLPINPKTTTIRGAILLQELLYKGRRIPYVLLIAVISVDKYEQLRGAEVHLCALIVGCGCTNASHLIAVDGQARNVEGPSSDTLVRLALSANAQGERGAHHFVGIKSAHAISKLDAGQIDQIYQRVNLIELLALEHPADERLGCWPIARRILTTGSID